MKKPILTKILLVIVIILLFFFSLLVGGRNVLARDNVKMLVESIDVQQYLDSSEYVSNLIEEKRLNHDLFSYVGEIDKTLVINNILDNLYGNKEDVLVESSEIENILKKAIIMYENENSLDIYLNIKEDISELSNLISSKINNKDFIMQFSFIYNIANGSLFYLILFTLIFFIIVIFVIERGLGFALIGLVFLISSIGVLIFEKKWFPNYINNINMIKYFSRDVVSEFLINIFFEYCSILFIISICLLLIYGIICFRKFLRKIRIIFYDNYFGR